MNVVADWRCLLVCCCFFASAALQGRTIAGFHVDDESCSGLLINNRTDQELKCATYFNTLSNLSAELKRYSKMIPGPPLKLSVDVGVAWTCAAGTEGCFNLTFNGATKSVAEHVVDLADELVLMDYSRDASEVSTRARPFLEYADQINSGNKNGNHSGVHHQVAISVGLAIYGPPYNLPAGWQVRNESELAAVMATSQRTLSRYSSFKGFSVFYGETWRRNSNNCSNIPSLHWPQGTGVWYIDHKMITDQNTTQRSSWLAWAKAHNLGAVYIAPHAGSDPLISIPGKEGSPASDRKFCEFIHLAEEIGVEVQLLSTPELDIDFIQNCSSTHV